MVVYEEIFNFISRRQSFGCRQALIVKFLDQKNMDYIEINSVKWATCNVGAKNKFVEYSEDYGNYYTFAEAQNVCPIGWRVPTNEEFRKLLDSEKVIHKYTIQNSIKGMKFIDKANGNSIFLPACGCYYPGDGELGDVGNSGYYWSTSRKDASRAYILYYDAFGSCTHYTNKCFGYTVRCVIK
jgi:uncharacterized protein (TIGR02145 family)